MPNFMDSNDFLSNSMALRHAVVKRETFDPTSAEHLESLKSFVETGNWGTTQFYCEFPFSNVPMTVLMKFAAHALGAKPAQRSAS